MTGEDVHFKRGFSCVACHGGDGSVAEKERSHDPARGWTGAPKGKAVVDLCGKCHSEAGATFMRNFNPAMRVDQVTLYRESHHGKKVLAGDDRAAVCVDVRGLRPAQPLDLTVRPNTPDGVAPNRDGLGESLIEQLREPALQGMALGADREVHRRTDAGDLDGRSDAEPHSDLDVEQQDHAHHDQIDGHAREHAAEVFKPSLFHAAT